MKASQKRKTKNPSKRNLRDVKWLLSSGRYLVRADREGRVNLGCAGGTWATNDVRNASIYGDQISVVLKPRRILQLEIGDAFVKYVDPGFGKEYSFADATDDEWAKLREGMLKDGYDALEITAPRWAERSRFLDIGATENIKRRGSPVGFSEKDRAISDPAFNRFYTLTAQCKSSLRQVEATLLVSIANLQII